MGRGISVSQKYGVNPSIPICYFCREAKNEVVLFGKLPSDAEAPRHCVLDMEPCDTCVERRKTHVHLIALKDGESEKAADQSQRWSERMHRLPCHKQLPFLPDVDRTGYTFWPDRDKIERMFNSSELVAYVLRCGWTFVDEELVKHLHLDKLMAEAREQHPDAKEIICRGVEWNFDERESPDGDIPAV